MRIIRTLVPALGLVLVGCQSDPDNEAAAAAAAQAVQPATATVTATPAAPAAADSATMLALTEFTVVDENGFQSGTFRNIGGTTWTGPDLVRGGTLRLEEEFKRDDQMILSAVRREAVDNWDLYEVSIQASGRVYIAYRPSNDNDWDVHDYTAIDLKTQ